MNFEAHWQKLVKSSPSLRNSETKMTMSVDSFQKQIKKAYRAGQLDSYVDRNRKQHAGMEKLFPGLFR